MFDFYSSKVGLLQNTIINYVLKKILNIEITFHFLYFDVV